MSASSTPPPRTGDPHRRTRTRPSIPAPTAACSCDIQNETGPTGQIVVLRVTGEIDMLTLPLVQAALTAAADRAPADLVVDLSGLSFCCVRGFALLAGAAGTARARGIGYAVSGLSPHLDRIATMLWPDQNCVRYRSVAAAVTAIRIDQALATTPPSLAADPRGSAAPSRGYPTPDGRQP